MTIAEELQKLHQSCGLSDEEFAKAKAAILQGSSAPPPPPVTPPGPRTPPVAKSIEQETRQWSMFLHLSQLASFVLPGAGLVLPIVIWQIKKTELPGVEVHGRMVANWIISELIYAVVCIPLVFLIIGIPLLIGLVVVGIVFPIMGGIKANDGEVWPYPLSLTFIK